jgi:predicted RNA binding protein YcfA (HicA-like mRNA interferase family)
MTAISGRELARVLERHGWTLLRVHGSHHIYGRPGSIVRLSVPVHAGRTLKAGLLTHLLKQAGLSEHDL